MALYEVIGVIPVRNRFVATARSMVMRRIMALGGAVAALRILGRYFNSMFVNMVAVRVV